MAKKDRPYIDYVNLGPYPGFLGFTTSPKAFQREMKRLNVTEPVDFVTKNGRADATTHFFTRDGETTTIITLPRPTKKRAFEQYAAMVAHEAVHAVQALWDDIGEKTPGHEAEAYLVQYITQFCLEKAYSTGRSRKLAP